MNTIQALSLTGALIIATANQARNALSTLHLFKAPFLPSPTTTKDQFLAQEADYDGYAPITLTAWGAPVLLGQGYATVGPQATFRWALETDAVGNSIAGWFFLTAAGDLIGYSVFGTPQSMSGPGQAIVTTPIQITSGG